MELLTFTEVAMILKIKLATVRVWVRRGSLPAVRLGGKIIRIPAEAVAGMVKAGMEVE